MALFFNLLVLEEETNNDPQYLVEALKLYYKGVTLPKNAYTKYKPIKKSLRGGSFLLNPKSFFEDKTTDIIYRAQYLRLAGRRDFSFYKFYGYKYLDLSYYSDINLDLIKSNPLIKIDKKQIQFKYE
jgi:hypothetical protein